MISELSSPEVYSEGRSADAIEDSRSAGIRVMMITGYNIETDVSNTAMGLTGATALGLLPLNRERRKKGVCAEICVRNETSKGVMAHRSLPRFFPSTLSNFPVPPFTAGAGTFIFDNL
ncbi:unnamed protein product [Alopecurus aequalis]